MFVLFLSWDLEYTGLVTNFGPVPFVPWGTSRRVGRSKNIHNEKASIFHETLEVGVKDAVNWHLLPTMNGLKNFQVSTRIFEAKGCCISTATVHFRPKS